MGRGPPVSRGTWDSANARGRAVRGPSKRATLPAMTTTENPCSRDLYLDLIIKVLANVIYGNDPSMHPDNRGIYRPELRADGRDWPSLAHSMAGLERLQNVRHLA